MLARPVPLSKRKQPGNQNAGPEGLATAFNKKSRANEFVTFNQSMNFPVVP